MHENKTKSKLINKERDSYEPKGAQTFIKHPKLKAKAKAKANAN